MAAAAISLACLHFVSTCPLTSEIWRRSWSPFPRLILRSCKVRSLFLTSFTSPTVTFPVHAARFKWSKECSVLSRAQNPNKTFTPLSPEDPLFLDGELRDRSGMCAVLQLRLGS